MIYVRTFTFLIFVAATGSITVGDEFSNPAGMLNTTSVEPSVASLHIQVDEILAERESAIQQLGPRHPQVLALDTKLSIARESLEKLKRRNAKLNQDDQSPTAKSGLVQNDANDAIILQLQQMVLTLTNRVMKLEDELSTLKVKVEGLTDPK